MVEENIVCIGCPLGCRTTLRIDRHGDVMKITGYQCREGRQYVLEEHRHPVRILTATIRVEESPRSLLPVRTNRPIPKTIMKEAARTLAEVRARPPVRIGQIIFPNLLDTGADVIATDDLLNEVTNYPSP
ncbi:MAG: DUF1667 domain-containing protein [Thermodesulfobacteriota bacterium]